MHLTNPFPPTWRARTVGAITLLSLVAAFWATPASAQLTRVTSSIGVLNSVIRGTDAAYDPVNDVYLLVGGQGQLFGVFTNGAGTIISSFPIASGTPFGQFPRAEYGADVNGGRGGFLVTWHHTDNCGTCPFSVHAQTVAYPSGVISPNVALSTSASSYQETGNPIAYSRTSHEFLVAWQTSLFGIQGRFVDINGSPIGGVMDFENAGGARDPGLAWNAATDEFGLSYSGWDGTSAFARFRKVTPSGTLSARTTFGRTSGTFNTDVDVNPTTNNYVMAYATAGGSFAGEFDPAGTFLGSGLISTTFGGSDNLSLSYNPVSGTFLSVGQHVSSLEVAGAELNGRGVPTTGATVLTSGSTKGSFYPRVVARGNASQWNIVYSRNFTTMTEQIIGTSSTGGGSTASFGSTPVVTMPTPTPTPTPTPVSSCPGADPFASLGGGNCVNGGWQPPSSTSTGPTGGCAGNAPFAGAVCQNGGWVPGAGTVSTGGCPGSAPFSGAVCQNGGWVPGSGTVSTGGCPGSAPFSGAVCQNGGWVPGSGGVSTGGCPGTAPFSGAVCQNGGWVPGSGSVSSGGCPGNAPFPGAVCQNGGWVPGSGSVSTSGCVGSAPFSGAVCQNGGWVPGTSPASSTCSTPNPFPSSLGGVCVNGGWVPGNSSLIKQP